MPPDDHDYQGICSLIYNVCKGDNMTKTQLHTKLDNIWYHYKTHILVGVFIVVFLIPMVLFNKSEKPAGLNVALVGNSINPIGQETLQKKATSTILGSKSTVEIKMDLWKLNGSITAPVNLDLNQKLMTQIGAKDIDVIIMDKKDFQLFAEKGAFVNLEDNQELSDIINNKGLQPVSYFGVDLTANKLLAEAGFDTLNKVLGVVANTKQKERSFRLIRWLISQQ